MNRLESHSKLAWQQVLPPIEQYRSQLDTLPPALESFSKLQPRFAHALTHFLHPRSQYKMLVCSANESNTYFSVIEKLIGEQLTELEKKSATDEIHSINFKPPFSGGSYRFIDELSRFEFDAETTGEFTPTQKLVYREWIEMNELFGSLHQHGEKLHLTAGLIHQVNGGILALNASTILAQPLMWFRLKQMMQSQQFVWLPIDEAKPLPVAIDPVPLNLRLMIIGDYASVAELQAIEPELFKQALFAEFESSITLYDESAFTAWQSYVSALGTLYTNKSISTSAWERLYIDAARYNEDHFYLPLCPLWWKQYFTEAALFLTQTETEFSAETFKQAQLSKVWRESYLADRVYDEIELDQVIIQTEGEMIGQINGLAVLEYPGHPRAFGEPSRISCVLHIGDGELTDVERKVELAGNLHAKGMLIMQAFLMTELELSQPFPLSASIVFEQSYSEVDGDSASLAELCVLISSLASAPIDQQLAITGSVDQFGNVQAIGGVNEKIEGFFAVCARRELTGKQGVIIPKANMRHLALGEEVLESVKNGQFHIWGIEHASEAIELLTGIPYKDEQAKIDLLALMQQRITQLTSAENEEPWYKRGLFSIFSK